MPEDHDNRRDQLTDALRRVVLLKETGPKSAAWHRARVQTIWRLHQLLDREAAAASVPPDSQPTCRETPADA